MNPIEPSRNRNVIVLLVLGTICLWKVGAIPAAEPTPTAESQLRDRLRATMLQLRTAETDRAALQAAQAQWADEKTKLTERTEALTKQVNQEKQTLQVMDSLKSQVARQEKEIAQLKETIESDRQTAELARNKAAERDKLVEEVVLGLERLVVDRQEKNLALYKIGNEVLQRYEKFGLGVAITAREPFTGITRVKLQNLVQDYQDKLQSERVTLNEKDLASIRDKLQLEPGPKTSSQASK